MKTRSLTDQDMLRAARRALAAHRATRPATASEAAAFAADERAKATRATRESANAREAARPISASAHGHGPGVPAMRAADAIGSAHLTRAAMGADERAAGHTLRAEAWEQMSPAKAWAETEAALVARVSYYEGLVVGTVAA